MTENKSRRQILDDISNGIKKSGVSFNKSSSKKVNLFPEIKEDIIVSFVKEFQKVNGKFVFCESKDVLIDNLKALYESEKWDSIFCNDSWIQELLVESLIPFASGTEDFKLMDAAITRCEFLIARFGSVMVSSHQASGRLLNVFPPAHIVVAFTSQVVAELDEALEQIKENYKTKIPSLISLITGPSRTADIEKTLILGAHGPKDIYVFLVNDNPDMLQ